MSIDSIIEFLRAHSKFVIASHVNPDGDALGSSLGLAMALEAMGKDVVVYNKDGTVSPYEFLPGSQRVVRSLEGSQKDRALVVVDCNNAVRSNTEGMEFAAIAVVDHHLTTSQFGDVRWIEPTRAAVGLMIYDIVIGLGATITKDIATNLYAAIAIDTGIFRYSNTTEPVLHVAASLVGAGADPAMVADKLYQGWPKRRFELLRLMMAGILVRDRVAISLIDRAMFERTGTDHFDTENFVNFPMLMDDVKVSAFVRETDAGVWKVSIRSKGQVNVAEVASKFQGGGHKNAAGCTINGTEQQVVEQLIDALNGSANK